MTSLSKKHVVEEGVIDAIFDPRDYDLWEYDCSAYQDQIFFRSIKSSYWDRIDELKKEHSKLVEQLNEYDKFS